jgi:hypothetical protein
MAKLTIEEYADQAFDRRGQPVAAGLQPSLGSQQVDFTAGVTASAAFNAKTRFVRLHTDAIAAYAFGNAPVAVITGPRMTAGQTEYFGVEPAAVAGSLKVSAIITT